MGPNKTFENPRSLPETDGDGSVGVFRDASLGTGLSRREWVLAGLGLAASLVVGKEILDNVVHPFVTRTEVKRSSHFDGALEVSKRYNAEYSGVGSGVSFSFTRSGHYRVGLSMFDGYQVLTEAAFSIERADDGSLAVQAVDREGQVKHLTQDQFAAYLRRFDGSSRASTQMELCFIPPDGVPQSAADYY